MSLNRMITGNRFELLLMNVEINLLSISVMKYEKICADEYNLTKSSAEASRTYLNTKFLIFTANVVYSYVHDWHSFNPTSPAADFY